jgi:hypothetical protein
MIRSNQSQARKVVKDRDRQTEKVTYRACYLWHLLSKWSEGLYEENSLSKNKTKTEKEMKGKLALTNFAGRKVKVNPGIA